jgi:hypothetical protein
MTHEPNERTAEDIRREIAETREELGDTVAALAEKTDVKAQVKGKVEDVKSDVREKVDQVKEKIPGVGNANGTDPYHSPVRVQTPFHRDPRVIGAGLALGIALLWAIRRRR